MTTALGKNAVADIITQAMAHNVSGRRGNTISVVTKVKSGEDRDLGISGTVTETVTQLEPEPFVSAVSGKAVQQSGGAFMWSDLRMAISKDSIDEATAINPKTEFMINGERYKVVAHQPSPSVWEFVIRRETASPVTP